MRFWRLAALALLCTLVASDGTICHAPDDPPGRDRGRAGDEVLLTGPVGGSGLGRHLFLEPRLAVGRALHAAGDTAAARAAARRGAGQSPAVLWFSVSSMRRPVKKIIRSRITNSSNESRPSRFHPHSLWGCHLPRCMLISGGRGCNLWVAILKSQWQLTIALDGTQSPG